MEIVEIRFCILQVDLEWEKTEFEVKKRPAYVCFWLSAL